MEKVKIPNRQAWLDALRGGKYLQGRGELQVEDTYCCIGVWCVINNIPISEDGRRMGEDTTRSYNSFHSIMDGHGQRNFASNLVSMNDKGIPFTEIADFIEQNLEEIN